MQISTPGKPNALNYAISKATGEIFYWLDADGEVDPDVLWAHVQAFKDPKVGATVGCIRLRNSDVNSLTLQQEVEALFYHRYLARGRHSFGGVIHLAGKNNAIRTCILRKLGGFKEDSLTEDFDLTMDVSLLGYRISYVDVPIREEGCTSLDEWLPQRYRWVRGLWQSLRKYWRKPLKAWRMRKIGMRTLIDSYVLMLSPVSMLLTFLGWILTFACFFFAWIGNIYPAWAWLGIVFLATYHIIYAKAKGTPIRQTLNIAFFLYPYWSLLTAINLDCLRLELTKRPSSWRKTNKMGELQRRIGQPLSQRIIRWVSENWLVFPILIIAAGFRLYNLDRLGFLGDEAIYALRASKFAENPFDLDTAYYGKFSLIHQPPLLPYIVSIVYRLFGASDVGARLISVAFGLVTILVVYEFGKLLYDRRVGIIAMLLLSVNAYHINLSRQVTLDVSMTFFFVLSIFCVTKWFKARDNRWLFSASIIAALTCWTKNAGVLIIPVLIACLVINQRKLKESPRKYALVISTCLFIIILLPLLSLLTSSEGIQAALWQLGRTTPGGSSMPWHFYFSTIVRYTGVLFPLLSLAGIFYALKRRRVSDLVSLSWATIVLAFFQFTHSKAEHYLLPAIPALVLFAGVGMTRFLQNSKSRSIPRARTKVFSIVAITFLAIVVVSNIQISVLNVIYNDYFAGVREASYWIRDNTPENAGFLTFIQASPVIGFYANRYTYSLIEKDLRTNYAAFDVYVEELIAEGKINYAVFDVYEGTDWESVFNSLLDKYGGQLVHIEYYTYYLFNGTTVISPRVWIYKLTPDS